VRALDDDLVAHVARVGQASDLAGSAPAMHAAACKMRPELAPAVTNAASAPSMRAMAAPAASLSSSMFTSACEASRIASSASGRSMEPP